MKKLLTMLFATLLVSAMALPVFAQDAAAGGQDQSASPDAGAKKKKHSKMKKKKSTEAPKSDEAPKQ